MSNFLAVVESLTKFPLYNTSVKSRLRCKGFMRMVFCGAELESFGVIGNPFL